MSFRIAGPIDRIPVKEGQFVKKGELIALIDPRDYQLQYNATKAEYDQVINEVERYEKLYSKNNITDNDYEKAMSGKKQIVVKLNATKNALNDTRLVAPFDGYIQTLFVSKGEITNVGMPVISIINTSVLVVESAIPANLYIKKNHFKDFYCTSRNYPNQKFPLKILGINAKSGINNLYKMSLMLKAPEEIILAPGMNIQVHFSVDTDTKPEILIPLSACFEKDNLTYVYKYHNEQAIQTEVNIGRVNRNNEITIVSGLTLKDVVIIAGISQISNGQKVKLLAKALK